MKVKSNKRNALIFLGSSVLAITGENVKPTTAHASTVKTSTKAKPTVKTKEDFNKHKDNEKRTSFTVVTVKENDTTWGISQEYGTTVNQIVKDNNLQDGGALIQVNDQLKVKSNSKNSVTSPTQSSSTTPTNQDTATYNNYSSQAQQQQSTPTTYTSTVSGDENAAKEWIAARESGGSYTARNPSSGTYGRYQLTPDKLNGDYSPANQERVADQYVHSRYGSWTAAKQFWMANNWY